MNFFFALLLNFSHLSSNVKIKSKSSFFLLMGSRLNENCWNGYASSDSKRKKTCSMISSAGELNGSAMSMAWLACTDFVLLAGSIVILSTWIKKGRKAAFTIVRSI